MHRTLVLNRALKNNNTVKTESLIKNGRSLIFRCDIWDVKTSRDEEQKVILRVLQNVDGLHLYCCVTYISQRFKAGKISTRQYHI